MFKLRLSFLAALTCWVAICFVQCSTRKPQDDFKATMDAYKKTDNPATKIRLWRDFLKRNPQNMNTVLAVDYVAQDYFLKQQKDPDGAVKFALEYLPNLKSEKLKRRADSTLILFYGRAGNKDRLRELAGQIEARRKLTLDDYTALGDAAIKSKDWEFAREQGELLLANSTPETVRAEAEWRRSDEDVSRLVDEQHGRAFMLMGQASLELNDIKAALDHFGNAEKLAKYEYAGLASWPYQNLNLLWAKALLKNGNAQGAADKVAVQAVIGGDKTASGVLQEALSASGSKENLKQYIDRRRPTLAKTMPVFSAQDYEKKQQSWGDVKGQVTLVIFWFPT